jgi:hypothetical protein
MEHFCLGCDQILVIILRVDSKIWTSFFLITFNATMEFRSQPLQWGFAFQMAKNPTTPSQDFQLMPHTLSALKFMPSCPNAFCSPNSC